MTDVWTALIAAISGAAGLGGGLIAGRFNLKAVAKTHRRDDLATLRDKFEEMYAELDRVQDLSNVTSSRALVAMNAKKMPDEKPDAINLGKIRSIVQLYFPTCQPAIDALDQREIEDVKKLRADLKDNPVAATLMHLITQCYSISKMCRDMRELLAAQGKEVGKSVRVGAQPSGGPWRCW